MLYGVQGNLTQPWREQDVANSIATSGKTMSVNRLRRYDEIKFATWVANGQSACSEPWKWHELFKGRATYCLRAKQKRRLGWSQAALQF
ncbi:hypothetical protein [Mesorhizobium sp. M7A.F.Ca.CA.004.12.1.1]|jgi:hypothetical protein|uniref:hypothetical protein n=3 Tax=Phyllobacteriaceae TaxID=69277 RepID=UPI0019D26B6E|nr:hypothetical protein [Mesorhizobium sp. M7A.F.Ca.CA.004.12.1.1]